MSGSSAVTAPLARQGGIGGDDRGGQFVQRVASIGRSRRGRRTGTRCNDSLASTIVLDRPQVGHAGANPVGVVEEVVALDELRRVGDRPASDAGTAPRRPPTRCRR